jgi:hypothetical protein
MTSTGINKLARQITPLPGEDQPAFAVRFHTIARRIMPSTSARQSAMMQSWANAGDSLAAQAAIDFPADKYERRDGVCEFKEHIAQNADGSQSHYSCAELAAMTRNMNSRVAETGNYGSLIDGHTSDDPNAPQPDVLGHRGPYYLGQIGQKTPRWAIFSIEHHKREMLPRLASRPTRSAEVWRSPRIEDRILDPVAALGAETPRLDLGMVRYERTGTVEIDGQQIERYAAACMPGAASVVVPTDKYAENEGADMAMTPEDAQQVAQAVSQLIFDTPEWQFVQAIMQNGDGEADSSAEDVADDANGAGDEMESVDEAPGDPGMPEPQAEPEYSAPDESPAPESPAPESPAPESPPVADAPAPAAPPTAEPSADGAVEDRVAQLEAVVAELQGKLQGSQAEKYRREALSGLRAKGFQIDVEAQMEIVADMNGEGFERYAKSLEKTVTRVPLADDTDVHEPPSEPVRTPPTDPSHPDMDRYSRDAAAHVLRERGKGNKVNFADALADALAGKLRAKQ